MNTFQLLSAQPWVERLGATLLHFLWQGVLIAAVYAAARRWIARASSPNIRYALACTALGVMAAAPVLTWLLLSPPAPSFAAMPFAAPVSATAPAAVRTAPISFPAIVNGVAAAPLLPWVVAVWLAGAMTFWVRMLGGWICAERLRSRLVRPAPREWQQTLDRLRKSVRVSRPVRLLVSSLVQSPAVVGWLRPVVLVPVGALAGLPAQQMEALLLHELAHIRRHDYCVNVLQSVVEALLFYHPAIWWVSGHIRAERELCCDDVAVLITGDVDSYARVLAELGMASHAHSQAVMAANAGSLAHRIARLLGEPLGESRPASRTSPGRGAVAIAMFLAVTVVVVFGQPSARPKFEVASVKPSEGQGLQSVRPLPGGLNADATVRRMMQNAYNLQPYQIAGGPDWVNSERFEVDAKAGGSASRAQLFLMLQSLLEERFQLRTHRETREMPVYALVAARSGLKLPPPKEGGCVEPAADTPSEWAGGRMAVPISSARPLPLCGVANVGLQFDGPHMQGGRVLMPEFVRMLSLIMGRTVIDRTGFTARFDFQMDFQADETTPALPPPPPGALESRNPSIQTALQEQLGLRLESTKGPVDVVVIDRVERPAAN